MNKQMERARVRSTELSAKERDERESIDNVPVPRGSVSILKVILTSYSSSTLLKKEAMTSGRLHVPRRVRKRSTRASR